MTSALEMWRTEQKLTYAALAEMLEVGQPKTAERICKGENMPRTDTIEAIERVTGGAVTANDLHAACVDYQAGKRGRGGHQASLDERDDTVTEAQRA